MSQHHKISTATIRGLWNNWALAFGSIALVMLCSLFMSKTILPMLLLAIAYALMAKMKSDHARSKMGACYLMLWVMAITIFWSAIVMLVINLLHSKWFFGGLLTAEPFNPKHPYVCSLIIFPIALIVSIYFLTRGLKSKLCSNCQARFGYYVPSNPIATLYYREARYQLRMLLWLSLVLSVVDWTYYYLFYINVNFNKPDKFYFIVMPIAVYLLSLVYMSVRYMSMSDELLEVRTKKKEFLEKIDRIVPFEDWIALIQPHYYKGERGNKPYDLERMLRIYLVQNLYNLSDMVTVAEVIDSRAFSDFCGVESSNQVPDGDTLGRFRNLLIENGLQEKLFAQVVSLLEQRGLILKKGTIVDSTFIEAPSSTKNKKKERDPDAHSAKKGNVWHFGYKAHIGVDSDSGLVHTLKTTAANEHDVTIAADLLTGDEEIVYGDSGYLGAEKRPEALKRNTAGKKIRYKINRRPSQSKDKSTRSKAQIKRREREKSSVRAKVEHVFAIVKLQLRFRKTRYRGLQKQISKLNMLFALANLILADRPGLAA